MSNCAVSFLVKLGMRVAYGLAFGYSCLLALVSAQTLEHHLMPVVTDFKVLQAGHEATRLYLSGTFVKARDCRFVEVVAYSGDKLLDIQFMDDKTTPATRSRAKGLQHYGPWVIVPDSVNLRLEARHRCHALWDSTTDLIEDYKL